MRRSQWGLLVFLLLLSSSAFGQTFVANMSGAQEVPPCDLDGTGTALITFNGTTLNYQIVVQNIDLPPIAQHIHTGAAGVNGPILIGLPGTWVGNVLTGTTTTTAANVAAITANPAGFYVNVHTNPCPGGAVRGQLEATTGNVPTLSTWGIAAMALLIAGAAYVAISKL